MSKFFRITIEDSSGKSFFYQDTLLRKDAVPSPLENNPEGWQDIEFSFDTNSFYFGLFRSVSNTWKMTRDGAKMLRELTYGNKGKGYATDLYIRVWQQDRIILKQYNWCYYAKIDLTTMEDSPGLYVSINTMEGGIKSYLDANDGVTYDITCSDNSPQYIKIYFDGTTLFDKYNYSIYDQEDLIINGWSDNEFRQTVGVVFLNNEGDSVGVINGSPIPESITNDSYYTDSANYVMYDAIADITTTIQGTIPVNLRIATIPTNTPILFNDTTFNVYLKTATQSILIGTRTVTNADMTYSNVNPFNINDWSELLEIPVNVAVTIAKNEKLFIESETITEATYTPRYVLRYSFSESALSFSFSSKQLPTWAYALRSTWLGQSLLDKMSNQPGKYQFKSDFLNGEGGEIVISCGDALRNTDKISANAAIQDYYISGSFKDFFQSLSVLQMSIRIKGNELWMEPAVTQYTGATTTVELGELSELTIKPIKDRLINSIITGYKDQNYDQRAGKWEVNSEQIGKPLMMW
jgi:hypothetical protein